MATVVAAVLIGMLLGMLARPILDAYLDFKRAQLYKEEPRHLREGSRVR